MGTRAQSGPGELPMYRAALGSSFEHPCLNGQRTKVIADQARVQKLGGDILAAWFDRPPLPEVIGGSCPEHSLNGTTVDSAPRSAHPRQHQVESGAMVRVRRGPEPPPVAVKDRPTDR